MIKLTRQQKIHMVVHSLKGPLLFLAGVATNPLNLTNTTFLALVALVGATDLTVDALYWVAINKRPRSGSPDFLAKAKEPWIPDPLNPDDPFNNGDEGKIDKLEKPLLDLSLYRLTLEFDCHDCFTVLRRIFIGKTEPFLVMGVHKDGSVTKVNDHIIGVESRIREKVNH